MKVRGGGDERIKGVEDVGRGDMEGEREREKGKRERERGR